MGGQCRAFRIMWPGPCQGIPSVLSCRRKTRLTAPDRILIVILKVVFYGFSPDDSRAKRFSFLSNNPDCSRCTQRSHGSRYRE